MNRKPLGEYRALVCPRCAPAFSGDFAGKDNTVCPGVPPCAPSVPSVCPRCAPAVVQPGVPPCPTPLRGGGTGHRARGEGWDNYSTDGEVLNVPNPAELRAVV